MFSLLRGGDGSTGERECREGLSEGLGVDWKGRREGVSARGKLLAEDRTYEKYYIGTVMYSRFFNE